jgi:nitroreductase
MNFLDVVRKRRMVRSFTDEPVAPEVVERILDIARRGPTAGYSQGVEFVVITSDDARTAVAAIGQEVLATSGHHNFVAQAPVHVMVCVSAEIYRARYREPDKQKVVADMTDEQLWATPFWYVDAGAALMLMLLAAVHEGVAAAFVGGEPHELRRIAGVPEDYHPIGIVLLGHEAPDAREFGDVSAVTRPRRPLSEIVHRERW